MNQEVFLSELEKFRNSFITKLSNLPLDDEEFNNPSLLPDDIYKLHQKGITGKGVKIGVIDNGYNSCGGRVVPFSKVDINGNAIENTRSDDSGHGQLILEKIIGKDIGYAPDTEVYYLDNNGANVSTEEGYIKGIQNTIKAIEYMSELNVDILSMSIGFSLLYATNNVLNAIKDLHSAIKKAYDKGIIIVVAACNSGEQSDNITVGIPARFSECISVGANTENFIRCNYSSVGKVEIMAQAEQLWHYDTDGSLSRYEDGGTSSACPIVASIIALYKQQLPNLNQQDVLEIFKQFATDVEVEGFDKRTGYGNIPIIELPKDFKCGRPLSQDKTETNKVFDKLKTNMEENKLANSITIPSPIYTVKDKLNINELHNKGIKGKGVKIAFCGYGCLNLEEYNVKRYVNLSKDGSNWIDGSGGKRTGSITTSLLCSKTLGIAPESEVTIIRRAMTTGISDYNSMRKAIEWCLNSDVDIAVVDQFVTEEECKKAYNKGIILIATSVKPTSSGQAKFDLSCSESNYAISVGWIPSDLKLINEMGTTYYNSDKLDCLAFGKDIDFYSDRGYEYYNANNNISSICTHIATSQVAGVLALIKQQDPSLDVFKAREYLKANCKDLGLRKNQQGYGLIQAKIIK